MIAIEITNRGYRSASSSLGADQTSQLSLLSSVDNLLPHNKHAAAYAGFLYASSVVTAVQWLPNTSCCSKQMPDWHQQMHNSRAEGQGAEPSQGQHNEPFSTAPITGMLTNVASMLQSYSIKLPAHSNAGHTHTPRGWMYCSGCKHMPCTSTVCLSLLGQPKT